MRAKHTEKLGKSLSAHTFRRPAPPLPARAERAFAAPPVARFVPAKAVGTFVPALTRKSFEKFGFSTATLIMDWAGIVGAEVARYTAPERLKWPRGAGSDDEAEDGRPGATLMLRVDPARALDVEYRARQLIERINAYFGYRAIETIRLIQAPLPLASCEGGREGGNPDRLSAGIPPSSSSPPYKGEGSPSDTASDPLQAALARLERGVRRDQAARH